MNNDWFGKAPRTSLGVSIKFLQGEREIPRLFTKNVRILLDFVLLFVIHSLTIFEGVFLNFVTIYIILIEMMRVIHN